MTRAYDPETEQLRGKHVEAGDVAAFWRRGLTPACLSSQRFGLDMLLRDRVVFRPRQRFAFARQDDGPGPVWAYTFPARDQALDVVDVVAWHPRTGRLASWLGRVGCLGEADLWSIDDEPLRVHRDPAGFLAAGWRGAVVVHETAARRRLLDADRRLQAEDLAHGVQLEAMLSRALPSIVVPAETEAAA